MPNRWHHQIPVPTQWQAIRYYAVMVVVFTRAFLSKVEAGWVKKTRQGKRVDPGSDTIRTEQAFPLFIGNPDRAISSRRDPKAPTKALEIAPSVVSIVTEAPSCRQRRWHRATGTARRLARSWRTFALICSGEMRACSHLSHSEAALRRRRCFTRRDCRRPRP
jgi:hypothetical protein